MKLEKINPSVKMITIFICVILIALQYLVTLNLVVFGASLIGLLLFSDAKLKHTAVLLLPAFLAAFGLFMMGLYYARGSSITPTDLENVGAMPYMVRAAMSRNLYTALQLSTRLLAFAGMGIMFALSTDREQFVFSLMHQCHMSPKFAYGILAAVNLMPQMLHEYRNVRTAFEVRNMKAGPFSMKVWFTMMVNSIRWSEAVAMAMESKGFCSEAPRTYREVPRVHWYDILFAACCIGGILIMMQLVEY